MEDSFIVGKNKLYLTKSRGGAQKHGEPWTLKSGGGAQAWQPYISLRLCSHGSAYDRAQLWAKSFNIFYLIPSADRLQNDLLCVEWDVKPYTLTPLLLKSSYLLRRTQTPLGLILCTVKMIWISVSEFHCIRCLNIR